MNKAPAPLHEQISELTREISIARATLERGVGKNKFPAATMHIILWRLESALDTLEKVSKGELVPCLTKSGTNT